MLKQRIGPTFFKTLNKKILQELYGISDPIKSSRSIAEIIEPSTDIFSSWKTVAEATVTDEPPETPETPQNVSPEPPSTLKDQGLWGKLYRTLDQLEEAKQELKKLEEKVSKPAESDSEGTDVSSLEIEEQQVESTAQVSPEASLEGAANDQTNEVTQKKNEHVKTDDEKAKEQEKAKLENDIKTFLEEASAYRFDILNVATKVVGQNAWRILFATTYRWTKQNRIPLLFAFVLTLLPILILFKLTPADSLISLTAKLAGLIAPIMPAAALLMNLIKSGNTWFEESRLALAEYKTSVEKRNREREDKIKASIEQSVSQNKELQGLQQEVEALKRQVREQEAVLPINQYATLADFISARLDTGDYEQRLGLMHQVKTDLFDLSNKLLPPSRYDPQFEAQIKNLQEVFPRGPARVVVYIDDLDRCPPPRVVEVLEAVQLLVKTPLFIAALAIDERYITRALEKHYEGVLHRRGSPSGTDYLEKIIQLPYRVRPIMPSTLETYLRSQIVIQDGGSGGAKFNEFSRQEFDMLLECCKQVDLSPRTLKRLTNVYKLFKIVCRTRGTKPSTQVQKAILALLALSGRYPDLMRGIFGNIETCFEEGRTQGDINKLAKDAKKEALAQKQGRLLHLQSPLTAAFDQYTLPASDQYLHHEFEKLRHDALETTILPPTLTLKDLSHEIFNLIRSFSFVGDIGEDPEDYRYSGPGVSEQPKLKSTIGDSGVAQETASKDYPQHQD